MKRGWVLCLVLSFFILVSFVSAERFIVEVDDSELGEELKGKVVGEIGRGQVSGVKVGVGIKRVVIDDVEEEDLIKSKGVRSFEIDYKVKALQTPWNMEVIGMDFDSIGENFGEGVRIAVLDSGADFLFLDVESGPDFVNGDPLSEDDNGHGTFVTQILKNGEGLPLSGAEIFAVKVLDENGIGYVSTVFDAILWASANNIDIVIMSFGGDGDSSTLRNAIGEAYDNGLLLVAAAGNNAGEIVDFPARYGDVISVGSVRQDLEKSGFSSYGDDLEFVAPGENILLTDGNVNYLLGGTSFSAPHAGIVAAYYFSENPGESNVEIRGRMRNNALDLGGIGKDNEFGYGLVRVLEGDSSLEIEERVGVLEEEISEINSWKASIDDSFEFLLQGLGDMWIVVTGLVTDVEEIERKIEILEAQSGIVNGTFPFYLDYLSSSDRKRIVCGYAEDHHLEFLEDLGWSCKLRYRSYKDVERASCRCKRL